MVHCHIWCLCLMFFRGIEEGVLWLQSAWGHSLTWTLWAHRQQRRCPGRCSWTGTCIFQRLCSKVVSLQPLVHHSLSGTLNLLDEKWGRVSWLNCNVPCGSQIRFVQCTALGWASRICVVSIYRCDSQGAILCHLCPWLQMDFWFAWWLSPTQLLNQMWGGNRWHLLLRLKGQWAINIYIHSSLIGNTWSLGTNMPHEGGGTIVVQLGTSCTGLLVGASSRIHSSSWRGAFRYAFFTLMCHSS